jgi:hypothetical protein
VSKNRDRALDRALPASARVLGVVLALSGLVSACRVKPEPATTEARTEWPAAMKDSPGRCEDVQDVRVCWDGPRITVAPHSVPPVALSRLGFRCTGAGAKRVCVDRALGAEEFRCEGARCDQRHPRLPDAGEWECADIAGAVFCRGGEPPAGAPPAASDPGFVCGPREKNGLATTSERLCVDWSPDFPDGASAAHGQRCRFEEQHAAVRVCEQDPKAHSVGDACDREHPCIGGLVCIASARAELGARCVPPRPEPTCWVDGDCRDRQACRFGTCMAESP